MIKRQKTKAGGVPRKLQQWKVISTHGTQGTRGRNGTSGGHHSSRTGIANEWFLGGKEELVITKDKVRIRGGRGDERYNFPFLSPSYPIPLGPVMIRRRSQLTKEPREASSDIAFKAQKSKALSLRRLGSQREYNQACLVILQCFVPSQVLVNDSPIRVSPSHPNTFLPCW